MEFSFDVNALFPETITKVIAGRWERERGVTNNEWLAEVVEKMGQASAKAQGLRQPITTFLKLRLNKEVLYILKGCTESGKGTVLGMIKVGRRKLFLADHTGIQHEVEPVSVLDFYVHESKQRSGYGKKLFEAMMEGEGVKASEVAIDRPSVKFLGFLKKHYSLQSYIQQANHFVVFDEFFKTCQGAKHNTRRSCQGGSIPQPPQSHSKIPTLESGSKISKTPLQSAPSHTSSSAAHTNNQSNTETKTSETNTFNWTINSMNNSYQQDRLTYKLRNIQGTGCLRPEENSASRSGNKRTTVGDFFTGNPAPFLNMRSKGVGAQSRSVAGVLPSVGTGLTGHQHRSCAFAGYSRHGSLGGGGVLGNRVGLKEDTPLGQQGSTYYKSQTKDSWKQFIR